MDPKLVKDADGLYRLASGSPAINAGAGSYPFAAKDFDLQSRTGAFDVGADEYLASGATRVPLTKADVGPAASLNVVPPGHNGRMPELPEVEVVRVGLQAHVAGRTIRAAEVLHPRAIRRHALGARGLHAAAERHARRGGAAPRQVPVAGAVRQGGAAGPPRDERADARQPEGAPDEKHLRVRLRFDDDGPELRFVDQRTFGGLALDDLVDVGGDVLLPDTIAHIARDPMDPAFDLDAAVRALRSRRTEVKRALLDQTLVSGIGNIYADEALWRAKLHWSRPTEKLITRRRAASCCPRRRT